MSTNAVIRIDGYEVAEFYKHYDGYPSSTLKWLQEFNENFNRNDPSYKFAQLIRSSAFDSDKFGLDASRTTGWGVTKVGESYYDFLYILKADGYVEVIEQE
jgi:hypothetical protein